MIIKKKWIILILLLLSLLVLSCKVSLKVSEWNENPGTLYATWLNYDEVTVGVSFLDNRTKNIPFDSEQEQYFVVLEIKIERPTEQGTIEVKSTNLFYRDYRLNWWWQPNTDLRMEPFQELTSHEQHFTFTLSNDVGTFADYPGHTRFRVEKFDRVFFRPILYKCNAQSGESNIVKTKDSGWKECKPTSKELSIQVTQNLENPTILAIDYEPHYIKFIIQNNDDKDRNVNLTLKSGDGADETYPYKESQAKLILASDDTMKVAMPYAGLDVNWSSSQTRQIHYGIFADGVQISEKESTDIKGLVDISRHLDCTLHDTRIEVYDQINHDWDAEWCFITGFAHFDPVNRALRPFGLKMDSEEGYDIDWVWEAETFGIESPDSLLHSACVIISNDSELDLLRTIVEENRTEGKYCVIAANKLWDTRSGSKQLVSGAGTRPGGSGYTGDRGIFLSCPVDESYLAEQNVTLVHELGHSIYGFEDNYDCAKIHDPYCLMSGCPYQWGYEVKKAYNPHFGPCCADSIRVFSGYPSN